jgi:hypothetical protein
MPAGRQEETKKDSRNFFENPMYSKAPLGNLRVLIYD